MTRALLWAVAWRATASDSTGAGHVSTCIKKSRKGPKAA
jgi:hypothetical protein